MRQWRFPFSINLLLLAIVVGSISVPIVYSLYLAEKGVTTVQQPIKRIAEKIDCVTRAVLGREESVINPELSQEEQDILAIAAGVAIDREGERANCVEDVDIELIDTYIRIKEKHPNTSYEDLVTKSYIWWPDDEDKVGYWLDRPICLIRGGRVATVDRLKVLVKQRLQAPRPAGCANKIVRAKTHAGGLAAGEWKIWGKVKRYPSDKRWEAKEAGRKCKTLFRCER